MKKLLKSITKAEDHTKTAMKEIRALKRTVNRNIKAPKAAAKRGSGGGSDPNSKDSSGGGGRGKVVEQLIQLLRVYHVTAPVGAGDVYANDPIGFSQLLMNAYVQDCRKLFKCPSLANQTANQTIGSLADKILAAGGVPA